MRIYRAAVMASISLLPLAVPAFAQDASASDASVVSDPEIVVTARRRDEAIQDVPLVVNAVSAATIEKLNIREGLEVQNLVPGLQLRNEANGIGSAGQLRGIQYDVNSSAGPSVAFYLNDAPIDAGSVLMTMYDMGQIEVLRGPQGTLRGASTPSGSITFTTRKPNLSQAGMNLSTTVTDTGTFNLNGALNIPIVEGVLGIRLAGVTEETNANRVHSIESDADLDQPFANTNSGRVIATLQPTDWLKLEGMYQTTERRSRSYDQYASFDLRDPTAPASPLVIRPKDRLSIQETARTTSQNFEVYNWRAELRYGGQALIYQGSQLDLNYRAITNQDMANFLPGSDIFQDTTTHSKVTSHEVRLQNEERVFDMLDYVVGYYQTDQKTPTELIVETPITLPTFLTGGIPTAVFINQTPIATTVALREKAFFGNLTFHLDDSTQISGGLRYLNLKSPASFLVIGGNSIPTSDAVDDDKLIYTASIQHNFTPDLMVYANTGTSFRSGPTIVNPGLVVRSPLMDSFIDLDSETSESYELGLKSSWLDNTLMFNITGYYQKFKNYPYKLSTPIFYTSFSFNGTTFAPGVGSSAQFGAGVPVEVKGVEAELSWAVSPNFHLGLLASYSDGKIKNGTIPCNDLNGDGVPDVTTTAPTLAQLQAAYGTNLMGSCSITQRSSVQSPFSATAQAEYNYPVSSTMDVFARGLFTYYGSSKVEPTNAFDDLGAYGLLNLYAGIRDPDGAWEVNAYAKNVFDTIKATRFDPPASTSYQELAPPTFQTTVGKSYTSTYSVVQTTAPQEFGINFRVAFGSR